MGKPSHAYLFTGPRGTGKTSTARILAKAVNCLNWDKYNDVCNECSNCIEINNETSIDFIEIDAASNRGIDEVRKLKEGVNFLPSKLKKKIYIIDEVHMMTRDAFNSLLKTLEEPPEYVVFIMATTEPHKVPDTILSRVQRFDFQLVDETLIKSKIEHILDDQSVDKLPQEVISLIYNISGGSFRDAESLLAKVISYFDNNESEITAEKISELLGMAPISIVEELVQFIYSGDISGINSIYSKLLKKNIDTLVFLKQLFGELRKHIDIQISKNEDFRKYIEIMNQISERYQEIKYSDDPETVLKLVLLSTALGTGTTTAEQVKTVVVYKEREEDNGLQQDPATIDNEPTNDTPTEDKLSTDNDLELDFRPVINEVARKNSRSAMMLKSCRVDSFTNSSLILSTSYKFYSDVMNKSSFQQILIESAKNVYPSLLIKSYVCEYDKDAVSNMKDAEISTDENISGGPIALADEEPADITEENVDDLIAEDDNIEIKSTNNKELVENLF